MVVSEMNILHNCATDSYVKLVLLSRPSWISDSHTHKIESWSHRIIIPAQIESIRFLWTVDKGIHTHDSKFPYILFHIKLKFFKFKLFLISKFSYFPTKKKTQYIHIFLIKVK